MTQSNDGPSNWAQAKRALRDTFLTGTPVSFVWMPPRGRQTAGRFYVDDIPVSEAVWELAYAGKVEQARALWLAQFDAAA